jgi:hypothetical protein
LLEASPVPVSPLPFFRSPQDNDALDGRGSLAGGAQPSAARFGTGGAVDVSVAGAPHGSDAPALLVDDGRVALTVLNETRAEAARIGASLEQLETADTAAGHVDRLLGRLRDAVTVAIRPDLEPAQRAVLQRSVDQMLGEIDGLAEGTVLERDLLRIGVRTPSPRRDSSPTPFRQIGTVALGLTDLAVRSSDQALAAAGALDLASARLERTSSTVRRAIARSEHDLAGLTSPPVTATGELALGNTMAAFGGTIQLRSELLANPGEAMRAQSDIEVSRVFRLLDSSER